MQQMEAFPDLRSPAENQAHVYLTRMDTYLSHDPDIIIVPSDVAFSAQTLSVWPMREKSGSSLLGEAKENPFITAS
jgi:hypothetical protein